MGISRREAFETLELPFGTCYLVVLIESAWQMTIVVVLSVEISCFFFFFQYRLTVSSNLKYSAESAPRYIRPPVFRSSYFPQILINMRTWIMQMSYLFSVFYNCFQFHQLCL